MKQPSPFRVHLLTCLLLGIVTATVTEPTTAQLESADSQANSDAFRVDLPPLPEQPPDVPWPTARWPRGQLADAESQDRLQQQLDALYEPELVAESGLPRAALVVQGGRIVGERYDEDHSCDTIAWTGSVAKIQGAVMAGLLIKDGLMDFDAVADVEEWHRDPKDPRSRISNRHVFSMTSGLAWDTPYGGSALDFIGSHFMEMAFGEGVLDSARYTWEQPSADEPGTRYHYNDGLVSVAGYLFNRYLGVDDRGAAAYLKARYLDPLGMRNTEFEFDAAGNWYGASGVRWSPCDMARFALLTLRDGNWNGAQVLPRGWTDEIRSPTRPSVQPFPETHYARGTYTHGGYGVYAFVYGDYDEGVFTSRVYGHIGFGGTILLIAPEKDLIAIYYGNDFGGAKKGTLGFAKMIDIVRTMPPPDAESTQGLQQAPLRSSIQVNAGTRP